MQHKIFCVCEFIKTESATAVQRAFRLRFNIQPPTRKSICRWNHQFEQTGCLCKGKSSGRPRVSEENVRRIEESFERSPRKSTQYRSVFIFNVGHFFLDRSILEDEDTASARNDERHSPYDMPHSQRPAPFATLH